MKMEKCDQLLSAVKTAVSLYGIEGASTRVIAKTANVDDGHIYRFFKTKEEMLVAAYKQESEAFYDDLVSEIDYLHNKTTVQLPDGAKLVFHFAWKNLLSNPEYCLFESYYYHSPSFSEACEVYSAQVKKLVDCVKWLFDSPDSAERFLFSVLSVLFDFTKKVIDGTVANTTETEDAVFNIVFGMLLHQTGMADSMK